jgi:hypothetical protein
MALLFHVVASQPLYAALSKQSSNVTGLPMSDDGVLSNALSQH